MRYPKTAVTNIVKSCPAMESGTFWSAGQRCGHSLHEISYRACFKPALAAYFIEQFSKPGEVVFDPFMGRGTTPLEAALRGRIAAGAGVHVQDVNRLLNQFEQMQGMMKKMKGSGMMKMMKRMGGMKGMPKMPF